MKINFSEVLLLLLASFSAVVRALVVVDSTVAEACIYYDKTFDWGCGSHGNSKKVYKCRCGNVNWLGTVTNCVYETSNDTALIEHALKHISQRCRDKGGFDYSLDDMVEFYENGTNYLRNPTEADYTEIVNTTLKVDFTEWEFFHKGFKDFTFSVQRSQWFGWGLVFFWTAIIGMATFMNMSKRLFGIEWENNLIRRKFTLPSIWSHYHNQELTLFKFFKFQIPTTLQFWIVVVFLIQVILSCSVGYNMIDMPHPFLTSRYFANMDLISYRTDMMAISLFPIVYLFGIRNNPFIPLTGMSFATFNYYHRWTAYVMVVLAFIHSIIWTVWVRTPSQGPYSAWWVDPYWRYGVFATVFSVLLIFQSEKWIRNVAYEGFLIFHKVFNIAFIICMFGHMNILGWLGWLWAMVAIVVYERVCRIVRIILCGGLQSTTLVDCGNGVIKMTIQRPKYLKISPGSFVYVYFFSFKDSWIYSLQSHPFTVLAIPESDDSNLTIIFKVQKGITKNFLQRMIKTGADSLEYKILVEGPYGDSYTYHKAESRKFVGIAAGLGVTAVFPHFAMILAEKNLVRDTQLDWVINDLNCLSWFRRELEWLKTKNCKIRIFYTGSLTEDLESSEISVVKEKSEDNLKSNFEIISSNGRPDVKELVQNIVQTAENDLTFITCGPDSFIDSVRYNLKEEMKHANVSVALHEESFTW